MIQGMPKHTEFKGLLIELVNLFKPHTYMELGVQRGWIFNSISPLVERAVGVDIKHQSEVIVNSNVEYIIKSTNEFAKEWKDPIDFLFIDADHEENQLLVDFINFSKYVREGTGLIFLHDTHPMYRELLKPGYCHNAWKVARNIRRYFYSKFEIVTLPGPWFGLSIIRKAHKHLYMRNRSNVK